MAPSWPRWHTRGLLAWLSLCLVLVAGAELHTRSDEIGRETFGGPATVFVDANHPGAPPHLETSATAEHAPCPACLHQVRTGGAGLPRAAAVSISARWHPALAARSPLPRRQVPRAGGSRAPPLA